MCTSAARLQLAIAPASAGKTTAMRAPEYGVDRRWRPAARPRPIRCRSRWPCRANRDPCRHFGQTDLVATKRQATGLGDRGRSVDVDHHRRSGHGRHLVPRHRSPIRPRSRGECPSDW
jgi:hypothetical protein